MKVEKTRMDGVLLVKLDVFEDHRGEYVETYNEDLYREKGIPQKFIQDDISVSTRHVLRGMHGDAETWKLISCLYGKFYMVLVNNQPESAQYRQWISFTLSDRNRLQVLVPPRFANGFVAMSDSVIYHYKQTSYYNPRGQFTLRWDDPEIGIWWPVKDPILSRRDEAGRYVDP
ncbi:MAG: dTDP-4-dehydrorhamnose 3,5-epimerase [Lentisphaerae bacterium RIFOXYC12_FULL_60_16]|nr:MAG: dTDP-4-dehydrorhamnose 3,5-epimerase [Lentisphaerae bacterium RIFOXYC12_FULL_60_16]OGV77801.1 MAG: dTDP-4-dehydrorhamnose 3,5-epimerase [Lentisphaerae bacterium RIFOXYB12_FULL_60_10]